MARLTTTVTIEHGFIKVLVAKRQQVLAHRALMASPQFFREGLVRDTKRIGAMVQAAFEEMEVAPGQAIGAVPGFQTSLRLLELPKARGFDPAVVIPREASRLMGVSQQTSLLTWHQLPSAEGRTRWLVLSAARRAVHAYVETMKDAGLRVNTLEMRPFALARAVNQPDAIIAWVAPDGCEVVVVRESVPVMQQSLFWGAEPVEGLVLVYRLTEIIERTITAYDAENPQGPLPGEAAVYVCGSPISLDETVGPQVSESLQRPVGTLTPPMTYDGDFPVNDFVVNIGLTLREA